MKTVKIIPSKSIAHRAYICAALSEFQGGAGCNVICSGTSADIEATKSCLDALKNTDGIRPVLRCGESGSTLRFLIPVCAALGTGVSFMPEGRLPQRPLSPLREELERHGVSISPQGSVPLEVSGKLTPGKYVMAGNVSSQYISGLLFALPLLETGSTIEVTGGLESKGYIDLTLDVLSDFGIIVKSETNQDAVSFIIPGCQKYKAPSEFTVEGDWSNAAFWIAAGILGNEAITITGLDPDSIQGDRKIVEIAKRFGADIGFENGNLTARPSKDKLKGITIDASQIPDMVPVLALIASVSEGVTEIVNAGRLRIKESDRLSSVSGVLNALGADIEELPEGLQIHGKPCLEGGSCDSYGDHRIAMMAGIASLVSEKPVVLSGSKAANKSYPGFFDIMEELGLNGNLVLI